MAYVDPPTFVADDPLAADELNVLSEDIRDLHSRVEGTTASMVSLSRSTDTTLASATPDLVTWETEIIDAGGWWSSGTKIIVPASAIPAGATTIGISLAGWLKFEPNAAGVRFGRILVNGSEAAGDQKSADPTEETTVHLTQILLEVAAADEIEVEFEQTSGGSLDMIAAYISLVREGVLS